MLGTEGDVKYFPNAAYQRAVGHRLLEGLPLSEGRPLEVCAACLMIGAAGHVPDARLMTQFSHAMSCGGVQLYTTRHKKLLEHLAGLIRNHMRPAPVVHIERYVVPEGGGGDGRDPAGEPGGGGKMMDIVVQAGVKTYWIDVTVADPGAERYRPDSGFPAWPPKPLAAAGRREVEKLQELQRKWPGFKAKGTNFQYVPFALEATGAVGMQAREFLMNSGIPGDAVRGFMGQLSVLLARYGGRMLATVHAKSVEYQRTHPRAARRGRAGALA
jgi:hypothetical protein